MPVILLCLLFQSAVRGGSQDDPTRLVAGSTLLLLADRIYADDFGASSLPEGWRIHTTSTGVAMMGDSKDVSPRNALKWALYERVSDGQFVFVPAGTRPELGLKGHYDFDANIVSSGPAWFNQLWDPEAFAISHRQQPNPGYNLRDEEQVFAQMGPLQSAHIKYDAGLQKFLEVKQYVKSIHKETELVVAGDSQGGGMMQYICGMTRTLGYGRNSARLGDVLLNRIPAENQEWVNKGAIVQVVDPAEIVHNIPFGKLLGRVEEYETSKVYRDAYLSVSPIFGRLFRPVEIHINRDLLYMAVAEAEGAGKAGMARDKQSPRSPPVAFQGLSIRETSDFGDLKALSGVANPKRAVVFGFGSTVDKVADLMATKVGRDNVRVVHSFPTASETKSFAVGFGADTVIKVSQDRYREVTQGGYRRIQQEPLDRLPTPRRADLPPPDTKYPTLLPPPRQPPPPPAGGGPPGGGGGGAGGSASGPDRFPPPPAIDSSRLFRANGIASRFDSPSSFPRVGGVMLQGAAEVGNSDSQLTAGSFSLIFQGGDGGIDIPMLRRFVTALWATYFTADGPGISIDPVGNFTNRQAVRYIGRVINSDLGRVMRETDYMMKSWAVGTSRPDLENWLTPEEIGIRDSSGHVGAPSRFWFIPEKMKFRQAGNVLLFDDGAMTVKTEYLFGNKGDKSPENEKWAEQFTKRYGEVAQRYPIFDELFEYAKLVSLTKYLKERRIPLLWFLLANREMVITENSPGTVKAFVKKSDYFEEVQIAGGVDLSPSAEPGSFVLDGELLNALAEARKNAPPADTGKSIAQIPTIEVVESRNEKLTVTPSQTVVISESRSAGDNFATDLGLRLNGSPNLEIARYRRTDFPQVHTFGRDWHLMIPYSVKPGSKKRVACGPFSVPEAMVLHNNLTGFETVLPFKKELKMGTNSIPIAGYYPEQPEADLNIGLTPMSDMTFRLDDKLGCEFEFDAGGRLIRMLLADHLAYATNAAGKILGVSRAKDYEVAYEYGQKRLNWRYYSTNSAPLPFRLAPEGDAQVAVQNVRLPKQMRLFDAALGSEEIFNFDEKNLTGLAGYFPADTNRSGYTFLAFKTDGSLVLEHKTGSQITFDRSGEFRSLVVDTVERMIQGPYEVRFDYDIAERQYRIVAARVFDRQTNKALYAVIYKYARDGTLTGTSIASAK